MRAADAMILTGLIALAAPLGARDAVAQDGARAVAIERGRLDAAIAELAAQTGASIAIVDPRLARLPVRRVRGRMTADAALARMLAGTAATARRVGPGAFRIELAAPPSAPRVAPTPPVYLSAPNAEEEAGAVVVVRASKRDTPLGDYPGAATVVDGGAFSVADGGLGTEALTQRAAALTSTHLGPGRNKLFIRGIADSSFTGPTQATVGQYWGNTRVTYSAPDPSLRLYDVEAVELLEGPQGTLYGAGALGGIIRIQPQMPELDRFGGGGWAAAQTTWHGDPGGDAGTVLNVPLVEGRLGFRALGYGAIDGGYIDDAQRGLADVNRVETLGARGALRFAPDARWTIDLSGAWQSIEGRDAQYAARGGDGLTRESAVAQPFSNEIALGELAVSGDLGAVRLVSTLGIVDQRVAERFDATTGSEPQAFDQRSRVRLVTSETRLAGSGPRGGWLVGLHLLSNDTRIRRTTTLRSLSAPAAGVSNRIEEATLFGEVTVTPAPALALTAGARVTHSRLSGAAEDVAVAVAFRDDPGARASREETRVLPSAALRWRLGGGFSLFARYQQGYRPGGLGVRADLIQRFDADRVATIEAGMRWIDASGRLAVQAIAATTDWRDIQADIVDGVGFPVTANIGDGRVRSVEITVSFAASPELTFDASLHGNDSEVTTPAPVLIATLAGARQQPADALPNVADLSARAGVEWRRDLGQMGALRLRGHARYLGRSTLGIGPRLGKPQGDWLDTGLDLRVGNARRGISLTLSNLFDARGNRFALGSPFLIRDEEHVTPLRPRTIRLGFDHSF